jgi:hypothetical protein
MKSLKQIYIEASKEAGFTESDLPEFWYIVIERWLQANKTHFVNQHKYCDDVKKCMDHLLAEVASNNSNVMKKEEKSQ